MPVASASACCRVGDLAVGVDDPFEHQGASLLELDLMDDAALLCGTFDADPGLLDLSLNASFEADKDIQEPKKRRGVKKKYTAVQIKQRRKNAAKLKRAELRQQKFDASPEKRVAASCTGIHFVREIAQQVRRTGSPRADGHRA